MEQQPQLQRKLKRDFGKFYLLDRIGSGGMAEIYRARPMDSAGNGRVVVIKRILPHVAHDPVFTEMFKGEIQVCMGFNHPNTVQIYDFGVHQGQSYIAMEYIEGMDLRLLLTAFKNAGRKMPIEFALTIAEQAARGLHYAHTFENSATGEVLNLIHRDVSPQNILISYDGNVKVIDFGISKAFGASKAAVHTDQTQVGVIKGKVSYLSPEQALQRPIDGRSDLFSLGIVLWECLTLQKLFKAEGFRATAPLLMIQNCERYIIAPSAFNPDVPKELDQIVLKALAPRPEDRYKTAEEFEKVLHDFLVTYHSGFGVQDTGKFMKAWFKTRIDEDKKTLLDLNQKAQETLKHRENSMDYIQETSSIPTTTADARFAEQNTSVPWMTRKKAAGVFLYILTILILKLDGHYFFFERFLRAPERTRMALSENYRPRSIMLNLRVPTKIDSVREIHINDLPLDPKKPVIRVPLDQTLRLVVRYGKAGKPREWVKDFVLKSDYFEGVRSYTMPVAFE